MKSFIATFIIAAYSIALVTSSTLVRQCANGLGPAPISVTMNDCTNLPCTIVNGGSVNTTVEFTAVSEGKSLNCTMEYFGKGLKTGSIVVNDICSALSNAECPLKKGDTIIAKYHNNIIQTPPTVKNLTYHNTVYDENNVVQTCFEVTWNINEA